MALRSESNPAEAARENLARRERGVQICRESAVLPPEEEAPQSLEIA